MNPTGDLDFSKLFSGFYRHKGLVFAVSLVVFLLAAYLSATLPNVYRSSTLILITPQRIPGNIVMPTFTTSVTDRINAITQEIMSRTRLESIIKEFGLYPGGSAVTMEDRVGNFRGNIRLDIRRNDAFQISYDSSNPETAMKVANRLASLFIEQNLQVREQQAIGTTNFINSETERLRKELEEQEALVSHYKIDNRYELPEQLDANLRTVEQLRSELKGNMATASSMQERLASLQKQSVETSSPIIVTQKNGESEVKLNLPANQKIQIRLKELESLLVRYSERHPDVLRLRAEIAGLEKELDVEKSKAKKSSGIAQSSDNPLKQIIEEQVESLKSSIKAIEASNAELRNAIAVHQKRVENTPLRGIELKKVSRTYDITLRKYQDLLAKGLESQLSENLEKKQKGEQFQVVDPANLPLAPLKPNRPLILLGGLAAGMIGGLAAAFIWDLLDRSFKNGDDLASFVDLPILATIPAIVTRGAVLERRRAQGLLGVSTLGVLLVGLILIRLFGSRFF
ncbi:MAG: XrtA system polysaccharide chain length determinant [Candidatus Binatia bacterium]